MKVYFTKDISANGVKKVFEKIKEIQGKFAIKLHFGEEGNKNFINPELIKDIAVDNNATLIEANVLYVSKRRYTDSHIKLAKEHGFDFSPIDIIDSDGDKEIEINKKHFKNIFTGKNIDKYDSILCYSHFKGHMIGGFGGALKNIGMGLGSVHGKMQMHASAIPTYDASKCINCGKCVEYCPGDAITLNPVKIHTDKCIGCGSCIGVCPVHLYSVPWESTNAETIQERFVEYAYGIIQNKKMMYINVLANISADCDCMANAGEPFVKNIGIVASTDIVAVEQASLDLVNKACGCKDAFEEKAHLSGNKQIEYAEELGMGSSEYELVDID